ncbi:unnamed protein product [Amaranthus hypochondriacus]
MFRNLIFGSIRRNRCSQKPHMNRYLEDGLYDMHELRVPKLFKNYHTKYLVCSKYKELQSIIKNNSHLYASNNVTRHAQLVWWRYSQKQLYSYSASTIVNNLAKAFSLVSMRYHVMTHGALGIMLGGLTMAHTTCADAGCLLFRNSVSVSGEDRWSYMSILCSTLLEVPILLIRALYLAILFSPSIIMAPFADSFGPGFRKVWLHVVQQTLRQAGPAFIKWGQWASTRPDLFPVDLCSELAELQSKAPEHSFEYTRITVEKAFGRKISDIFESFEAIPVASGSIAQVHRATLKLQHSGRKVKQPIEVAVKVRHPGMEECILPETGLSTCSSCCVSGDI